MKPFFQWCDDLWISHAIRDSRFIFPVVESIHILGLTVLLGTVLIVSLRLLNLGMKQPVPEIYASVAGLRIWALITMLVTGFLLFCSEAMKCYEDPPFEVKMITLAAAILFQFTVVRRVASQSSPGRLASAAAAVLSLFLWFGVGAAGRAIGFY